MCLYICHTLLSHPVCETSAHCQLCIIKRMKCGLINNLKWLFTLVLTWTGKPSHQSLSWMNSFVTAHATTLLDVVMLVCALHWTAACHLLLTEQPKLPAFCFSLPLSNVCCSSTSHRTMEAGYLCLSVVMWNVIRTVCEDSLMCVRVSVRIVGEGVSQWLGAA